MTFQTNFEGRCANFSAQFGSSGGGVIEAGFDSSIKIIQLPVEIWYEGEYEVTPSVEPQILETAQKTMKRDVEIKAIPFFNVSNSSGGSTVYIGSEVL